jgi:hypothetical protein
VSTILSCASLKPFSVPNSLHLSGNLPLARYPSFNPPPDSSIPIQMASQHSRLTNLGPHVTSRPRSSHIRKIRSALDILAHRCIFCWLLQKPESTLDHLLEHCELCPNIFTTHRDQWLEWRNRIQLPPGRCWGCGCPQHVSYSSPFYTPHLSYLYPSSSLPTWMATQVVFTPTTISIQSIVDIEIPCSPWPG